MENKFLVDWFGFSLRLDEKNNASMGITLNIEMIFDLLGILSKNFVNVGKIRYYKECWKCNDISVGVPYDVNKQGYFINMSSQGCRYFENIREGTPEKIWRDFFCNIRSLVCCGYAVNITRFDNAIDDFSGILDVDRIWSCVISGEVCSRFRRNRVIIGDETLYCDPVSLVCSNSHHGTGKTVEFGSRKGNVMCRFYDKLSEQKQKHFDDSDILSQLETITQWTRMEFEFKNETAITMINAFCDESNYVDFFVRYVNGVLRFINRDDSNISRCSIQKWWSDFLGTTSRLNIKLGDYKPVSREQHMKYVYNNLYGVIYTAISIDGLDSFLSRIVRIAQKFLSPKHMALCGGLEHGQILSSAARWDILRVPVLEAC